MAKKEEVSPALDKLPKDVQEKLSKIKEKL